MRIECGADFNIKRHINADRLAEKIRDWYTEQIDDRKFYVTRSDYSDCDGGRVNYYRIKSRKLMIPKTYAEVRYIQEHHRRIADIEDETLRRKVIDSYYRMVKIDIRRLHGDVKSQMKALKGTIDDYMSSQLQTK